MAVTRRKHLLSRTGVRSRGRAARILWPNKNEYHRERGYITREQSCGHRLAAHVEITGRSATG